MNFYDFCLAGHLLGLESELHVSRDPPRGKRSNLSLYRYSNGNEVDLLVGLGPTFPIEIKAGMTIHMGLPIILDFASYI